MRLKFKSIDTVTVNLIAATLCGGLLRLWNLPAQIIGGDEVHAVRFAVSHHLVDILTTYHKTDNCLPLSAFYRLVLLSGGSLNEIVLRAPALVSGTAMVFLVPWLLTRMPGPSGDLRGALAPWLGWLLALSPWLVLYSRINQAYRRLKEYVSEIMSTGT